MVKKRPYNITKNTLYFTTIIAISSILSGCDLKEEKSYDYYVLHPDELRHDYNYCETHPSKGVCINIVSKYFKYQDKAKARTSIGKTNSKTSSTSIFKGGAFRDIDQPINSYGANG